MTAIVSRFSFYVSRSCASSLCLCFEPQNQNETSRLPFLVLFDQILRLDFQLQEPERETRNEKRPPMTLRLKFILYLVAIHLLFAGVAIYLLLQHRIWLLAVEFIFVVSLTAGLNLTRSLFGTIELIQTGAQFMRDRDFSSRFREVGHPEMDQLIEIYNRMADHLRDERTKLQEQNYFLDKILTASPSGIITLDFDNQIAMINPAAERLLQASKEELLGKRLSELETPFACELDDLLPGESKVLPLLGRRRVKCRKSQFLDRGFLRHFLLMEELTEELRQSEKAAYEKTDQAYEPRGEQFGRLRQFPAPLLSELQGSTSD